MAFGGGLDITHCMSDDADRGDWTGDCMATSADISLMKDVFRKVPSQEERNTYSGCGDMDGDGATNLSKVTIKSGVEVGCVKVWDGLYLQVGVSGHRDVASLRMAVESKCPPSARGWS
jgi:hypothetical protein